MTPSTALLRRTPSMNEPHHQGVPTDKSSVLTSCWMCPYERISGVKTMFWPPRDASINLQLGGPVGWKVHAENPTSATQMGGGWTRQSHGKQPLVDYHEIKMLDRHLQLSIIS